LHQREQAYETCLRRLALSPPKTSRAAEWIRTTTTRSLKTLTLPLVYGGMKRTSRHSESNRALPDTSGMCRTAGTLTAQWIASESNRSQPHCKCSSPPWNMATRRERLLRAAGAIRTLTTRGLSSVTLPLVYGGMVGTLGLAPSWLGSGGFTGSLGISTVNVPLGWPMGLAPIYSRFTASRLVGFGIDHSPPRWNRTIVARLSAECSAVELGAGRLRFRIRTWETNNRTTPARRASEGRATRIQRSMSADDRIRTGNHSSEIENPRSSARPGRGSDRRKRSSS
jgi:hypothetical protein